MLLRALQLTVFALLVSCFPAQILTSGGNDANIVKLSIPKNVASTAKPKSDFVCPAPETIPWEFFPLPCVTNSDCRLMGRGYLCCGREGKVQRCTKATRAEAGASKSSKQAPSAVKAVPILTTLKTTTSTTTTTTTTTTTPKPTTTTTTTTTPKPTTTTTTTTPKPTTPKPKAKSDIAQGALVCPKENDVPFQFFAISCVKKHSECKRSLGPDFVCCKQRCVRGTNPPITEQSHQPILGLIPRECPSQPFGELLFDTQTCETDAECWPRVCCPDGTKRYCRTAMPRFDLVPATKNFNNPLSSVASYLQCSPPPIKGLDLFPRTCSTSLDCFPNLCCQEDGNKFCRPARKSILALIAGVSQRVGSNFIGFQQNQIRKRDVN